ncbi:unnamed protein product [Caenorhabditis auriculariae]|uniref:Uncharacterized protein n=1 Tax=Caenorhabditis auriculariae TaxID=2777116 RepID=A0A8S1H8S9_9PELO|nr:unnamed protein product [Caenorhabditis auriculariae]
MSAAQRKRLRIDICNAIKKKDLKRIQSLTEGKSREFLENCLNENVGRIPLVEACKKQFYNIAEYLVSLGADPLVHSRNTYSVLGKAPLTALRIAIEKVGAQKIANPNRATGPFKLVKMLVEEGHVDFETFERSWKSGQNNIDKDECDDMMSLGGLSYEPLLFIPCKHSNLGMVKYLCEHGASVDDANDGGLTCLMLPSFFRSPDSAKIFKYLVRQGLSVDAVTPRGRTALHFAVDAGNLFLVQLLTAAGAKMIPDKDGNHPLLKAAQNNTESKIYKHLLEYVDDRKMKENAILLSAASNLLFRCSYYNILKLKKALKCSQSFNEKGESELDPNPAYDSLRLGDFQTGGLPRAAIMQCFIVRERILGQAHMDVRYKLLDFIDSELEDGFNPRNNEITRYALTLCQR